MWRLVGRVRPYAWGSRTGIAAIQGRPPSGTPEAELWYGAHPEDPSLVEGDGTLLELIDADPVSRLGAATVETYGPRLPFLLKLLAADQPLSLQVHPDLAQAQAGFAAEEAAGVPRDAPDRNYVDPNHKPELMVAVSECLALCGFRPVADSAALLDRLAVSALRPVVAALRQPDPGTALREAVTTLFALPPDQVVADVRKAATALDAPEYAVVTGLADRYPTDLGVVASLLLNLVRLRPGEAIYMPAGNPHAYLRGVGVEVMASSDNVLRAGLTPKHVDVPELLRILRYEELPDPRWPIEPVADGVRWWPTPMPDFRLAHATVAGRRVELPGCHTPRIVFCLSGEVVASATTGEPPPATSEEPGSGELPGGSKRLRLRGGEAAFVPAGSGAVLLDGAGEVFQAGTG
jgi:mannose-6-phosphate isomerase